MSLNLGALGRTAIWLAMTLAVVSGVIGAFAGTWSTVILAAVLIVLAVLLLLSGRPARPHR